jgi:cellobiose phosphorylase
LPYAFDDVDRSIAIHRHDLPSAWINYLSNGRMDAFVSQAGGGFCWWRSPLLFRLTRYRMHHLPADSPGFYVYLREEGKPAWSPTFRPCPTPPDAWEARHRPGHTVFTARKGQLEAVLTLFVSQQHDTLVWDLRLRNRGTIPLTLDAIAYAELSQLAWFPEHAYGYYLKHKIKTWYQLEQETLCYLYHHEDHPRLNEVPLVYFASTHPPMAYCGDRDAFMGPYRDERDPVVMEADVLGNESLHSGEACAALQHRISIQPSKEYRISYFLGAAPGALSDFQASLSAAGSTLQALREPGAVDREFALLQSWWDNHLGAFDCVIPDKSAQRQITIWNPVNSVHAGRYSRAINTFAPGGRGIGFRDSCQDMLAIAYRDPEWATRMFEYLLTLQFREGNTLHVAHPEEPNDSPDPVTRSDDHLWLAFLAHALVSETGRIDFLAKSIPYFDGGNASAWEHLKATVAFTESHLGAHKLPLTLHGDWNDIIGKFSRQGRGESVFAGMQYVNTLGLLIAIGEQLGDFEALEWLRDCRARQTAALNACAWDGEWWRRGYDDEGNPVGHSAAEFGRLWLNPQSWAVIAGIGTRDQQLQAMNCVQEQLDTGYGLKLLTPGFKTWPDVSDPFSGYGPGTGENGAIFCHANTWAVIAEALLGRGGRAWKYFRQMMPHQVIQKVGLDRYAAEPYAWVSNIVGPENPRAGWGNVSHITGTASWMDVACTAYLLGVRAECNGLRIAPCIPAEWESFTVTRRYRGTMVQIEIKNPRHVESGVQTLKFNGQEIPCENGAVLPAALAAGCDRANVSVELG